MFIQIESKPQGWRAVAVFDDRTDRLVYLGSTTQVHLRLPSEAGLQALVTNAGEELPYREGDRVSAYLPPEALRVLIESPLPAPREAGDE